MKHDLGLVEGKLSNLPWPFLQGVTLDEHNEFEMLSEFRRGFGLGCFIVELAGVGHY